MLAAPLKNIWSRCEKNARSIFLNGTCVLYKWHSPFRQKGYAFFYCFHTYLSFSTGMFIICPMAT